MKEYRHLITLLSILVLKLPRLNFDIVDHDLKTIEAIKQYRVFVQKWKGKNYEEMDAKLAVMQGLREYRRTNNTDFLDDIQKNLEILDDIRFKHMGNLTEEQKYKFREMDTTLKNLHRRIECEDDDVLQKYASIIEDFIEDRNFTSFSARLTRFEEELQGDPSVKHLLKLQVLSQDDDSGGNSNRSKLLKNFNLTQENMETKLKNVNRQIENIYRIMMDRNDDIPRSDKSGVREWIMGRDRH